MYSVKVELKLNNKERTIMNQHIGFARFVYNYGLSLYNQIDHSEFKGGNSKKIDLIKKCFTNITKKKEDYSWTNKLSSRVYQNSFRNLKQAFSRFFKGLGKYPRYKQKKQGGSFTVDSSNGVILQPGGKTIKLPTLGVFKTFEAIPQCVAQTYTISKVADRYYVSFSINASLIPPIQHEVYRPIGLDVNLSDGKYCVLSDGTEITYPKPLKKAITKLHMFQYHNRNKCFGNRKKGISGSKAARKYFQKVAKLHQKVANQRNDFLQKLTTFLALKYYWLKIETLNVSGMLANHKLAFHIADASFYRFKELLTHKMNIYGGYLECIDQWYPSSRLCHQCHKKKTDLGLKERLYVCSNPNCQPVCRDYNSAKNLEQAEPEWIINRVGSIRINVCGQVVADNLG